MNYLTLYSLSFESIYFFFKTDSSSSKSDSF